MVPALDVDSIYKVPIAYHEQGLDRQVCEHFRLENTTEPDLKPWQDIVKLATKPEGEVSIAVVGKYTGLKDAYKSLTEALAHGGIANNVCVLKMSKTFKKTTWVIVGSLTNIAKNI